MRGFRKDSVPQATVSRDGSSHGLLKMPWSGLQALRAKAQKDLIESQGDEDREGVAEARRRLNAIDAAALERNWAARANAFFEDE